MWSPSLSPTTAQRHGQKLISGLRAEKVGCRIRLIVVDNGSSGCTLELLGQHPDVTLIVTAGSKVESFCAHSMTRIAPISTSRGQPVGPSILRSRGDAHR